MMEKPTNVRLRELESEVVRIISRVTRLSQQEIRSNRDLSTELGVDSLTALHVVAALEKNFGITIPDEEIGRHRRLSDIVGRVENLLTDPDHRASTKAHPRKQDHTPTQEGK